MRRSLLLLPLLTFAALPARADVEVKLQQLKDIGILPEDKMAYRPEDKIDPKRANPFAERAKAKQTAAVETVETEEIKIRRVFDGLKITGITKYNGKYSALMGDLIIEEGAQIAPIIQGQTQILRATRVTDKLVEIVWVEGSGYETRTPRRIVKRVELAAKVGVLLAAQPTGTTDANAMTYLDENGKVIWPKKMAPNLEGMMDNLPAPSPSSTAALSPDEENSLMQAPMPADPSLEGTAPAMVNPGEVDPATAIEDVVEPAPEEEPGAAPPAEPNTEQ